MSVISFQFVRVYPFGKRSESQDDIAEAPQTSPEARRQISTEEIQKIHNVEFWYQKALTAVSPFERIGPVGGLIPSSPPLTGLPKTHEPWDVLAGKVPGLMKTNRVIAYIDQMPCLSATVLPEEYIYRPSVIVGSVAFQYFLDS